MTVYVGMLCFYLVAESRHVLNLTVVINKRALNVFACSPTLESLHYLRIWRVITLVCCTGDFETDEFLWNIVVSFGFCSCCGHPAMYCSTLPGETILVESLYERVWRCVCNEVVSHSLMSMSAAFLSKLTSVKMYKHLCGVNAFVFFLTCSLEPNPSCVPLGEILDIDALDPAELPQRESKNEL